ncbi:MAG TPA: sulfurtransferase [Anaerolineaceae bacterium]|nr:sulfurtransferase [Anaerolineaceae bacterium]
MYTRLISTDELAVNLGNPDWVIVDCRFDLAKPDWGRADYGQGHIPGAVYAHLNEDLSGPVTEHTGRHPLPDPQKFRTTLSRLGIARDKQVVCYDTNGGAYAVRLWWMLRLYGHDRVAILDGGWQKWREEQRPETTGIEHNDYADFVGEPQQNWILTVTDVERLRFDPSYRLIDARAPQRYRGEIEPIDTAAGHIPGALNRFHGDNLSPDGTFKPAEQLRQEYAALLDGFDPAKVVVYCGSGVTSIHDLLAMELAGYPGAKVFIGSWSEWIRDPKRPRSSGKTP